MADATPKLPCGSGGDGHGGNNLVGDSSGDGFRDHGRLFTALRRLCDCRRLVGFAAGEALDGTLAGSGMMSGWRSSSSMSSSSGPSAPGMFSSSSSREGPNWKTMGREFSCLGGPRTALQKRDDSGRGAKPP